MLPKLMLTQQKIKRLNGDIAGLPAISEEWTVMEGKYVEGLGNVRISEEVINTIVAVAALEVPGVAALTPRSSDIKGILPGKKAPAKNIRIEEQNGQVIIEVGVTIEFGCKLQEVSLLLQTEVKKAVESMTGLTVSAVNVFVQSIKLPEAREEETPSLELADTEEPIPSLGEDEIPPEELD